MTSLKDLFEQTSLFILDLIASIRFKSIVIRRLEWKLIVNWFQDRKDLINKSESRRCAVTIMDTVENGKIEVIQGIFDMDVEEFVDVIKYEVDELDFDAKTNLSGSKVKIYT